MKYAPYSASKIGCFKGCNRKFKYKYVDKIQVRFEPSEALTKGNIIHSFLENHDLPLADKIAALQKDKQIYKSPFYNKELIKLCLKVYNEYIVTKQGIKNFENKTLSNELRIALNTKLESCHYLDKDVLFRGYIDRISVDLDEKVIEINSIEDIPLGYELVEIIEE